MPRGRKRKFPFSHEAQTWVSDTDSNGSIQDWIEENTVQNPNLNDTDNDMQDEPHIYGTEEASASGEEAHDGDSEDASVNTAEEEANEIISEEASAIEVRTNDKDDDHVQDDHAGDSNEEDEVTPEEVVALEEDVALEDDDDDVVGGRGPRGDETEDEQRK